jgi:hypothetical protein
MSGRGGRGRVAASPQWQLALASRTKPPLPVALLRAQGRVVELGTDELAMDDQEARALLAGAGVGFSDLEVAELIERTEGWPVGLYLATLARQAAGPQPGAVTAFRGDDRLLVDYLRSELLGHLPLELVAFLTRTAVLDRMCGPLCDAVLETTGSGQVLAWLEESNLLLVPLDRQRSWYRYHHLFRELLRSELDRREPELVPQLQGRAAVWCEANGLPETAIDHAQAAGDADRVARLVTSLIRPTYAAGRVDTARRWLAWFEDQRLIERYPSVAVLGAYVQALAGQPVGAERWADAAERGSKSGTLPDGSTVQSYLAMLRALLCRGGVERMRADAQLARDQLGPGSGWRGAALLLEGMSYLLVGDADRADPILAHATEVASGAGALPAAVVALAGRSLVAIQRHDWHQAETLAEQALTTVKVGQLASYLESALGYAVAAHTTLHRGDVPRARVPVLEERPDVEQGPAHRTNPEQLPAAPQPVTPQRGVLVAGQHLQTRSHTAKGRPGGQPGREGTLRADQGAGGPLDPDPDGPAHEGGQARGHALVDRGPGHQRVPERIEQGRRLDRRRRRGGDRIQPANDVHRLRRGPSHGVSPLASALALALRRGWRLVGGSGIWTGRLAELDHHPASAQPPRHPAAELTKRVGAMIVPPLGQSSIIRSG